MHYAMHLLNARRPLSDRSGDALDAAASHIADREYSGNAGFEELRRAPAGPFRRGPILAAQIGTGSHKSLVVERNARVQPTGARQPAPHQKDMTHLMCLRFLTVP